MDKPIAIQQGFGGLVQIVDCLLGPGGCPWDQEQTHESLKRHLLEEAYETIAAIDSKDQERLREELGDLILQPVMHAQMSARDGGFDIEQVLESIKAKLISRHPHVFGGTKASSAADVLANWDEIKRSEKPESSSILGGVPDALPALLRAYEVSARAARAGFEWPSLESVSEKVEEERSELEQAAQSGDLLRVEEEIGDLLFAIVNLARWYKVEPEDALRKMVDRFKARFEDMEQRAEKPLREMSPAEWDELWTHAKNVTR